MSSTKSGSKPALEDITVRHRHRRGGRVREGMDYTWEEWQVLSGRRVVSRHDTEHLANKAAEALRLERGARAASPASSEAGPPLDQAALDILTIAFEDEDIYCQGPTSMAEHALRALAKAGFVVRKG